MTDQPFDFLASARRTIGIEATAVEALQNQLEEGFVEACLSILSCRGKVVLCGIGKSGHIAKKLAASLASTGTPACFLQAAEAAHGDLGMLNDSDLLLAISHSGTSEELDRLLPSVKRLGIKIISISGDHNSPLAQAADVSLCVWVDVEACPMNLAPTASTTAIMVYGDALTIALLEARGLTREQFALTHPGGRIGRQLLLKVTDVMHSGNNLPLIFPHTPIADALVDISARGFGFGIIIDSQTRQLFGVFSDGDLRRCLAPERQMNLSKTPIAELCTRNPVTISPEIKALDAALLMQQKSIYTLVVVRDSVPIGLLSMHDLLRSGVV